MNDSVMDLFKDVFSTSLVSIGEIALGDFRLDSSYFINESNIKIGEQIKFAPLSKMATVFFPGIFKRILVENAKYGIGFLTTSEMMMVEPNADKFLSIELTQNLEIYRVEENSLLVSRSGSVGNTIYVYDDLVKYAITEDALRVIPFDKENLGLLYFYFTSVYGKSLITGQQSGAVIDHIYEENLLNLSIPIFDYDTKKYFYDTFTKVKSNREESNRLLGKARSLVLKYNNLPPLENAELETLDPDRETDLRLVSTEEFTADYRFDAHFYNPIADIVVRNIENSGSHFVNLSNNLKRIFYLNRFKRTFVNSNNGLPYLAGKDIIKIRPNDVSYLSKSETTNLDDYKLERGWILLTCSGTIGRTCFIWKNFEDWVGTHDLIRIVSNDSFDSGYLYAFLSSEYGYHQILKYKHGAVIDHITPEQIENILVPIPGGSNMEEIGDIVRKAYNLRAEAIRMEDEAQKILTKELTGK